MRLPEHAEYGVVGPAPRPGPRGRHRRSRLLLGSVLVALLSWGLASLHQPSGTQALFTTRAEPQVNTIAGATWVTEPPTACGDVSGFSKIVYGTMADDVLYGGAEPQIIIGLAGNDTIYGGNGGDCLVGNGGNDRIIGGDARDILLGGAGDDFLDGGADADVCDGGDGSNDLVNCEDTAAPLSLNIQVAPDSTSPTDQPAPAETTASPAPVAPDQPAPVVPAPGTEPDPLPTPEPAPDPAPQPAPGPTPEPGPAPADSTPEATP